MCKLEVLILLVILSCLAIVTSEVTPSNLSISQLSTCKQYRIHDSNYRDFFVVENLKNEHAADEVLKLRFFVMTNKDAHILLSTTDKPTYSDPAYEIVFGAGDNSYSVLRSKIRGDRVASRTEKAPLSFLDPMEVTVVQKNDGTIQVGITDQPFYLEHKDPDPLRIKYVSFSTYRDTPSRWFYDCDPAVNQLVIEQRNTSSHERLERDLLQGYNTYEPPAGLQFVHFNFTLKAVMHDSKKSILTTRVIIELEWNDPKLQWEPYHYNITGVRKMNFPFWMPSLMIYNGVGKSYLEFSPPFIAYLTHEGNVKVNTKEVDIQTWCGEGGANWPNDQLECHIMLGMHGNNLYLQFDHNNSLHVDKLSQGNQWLLEQFAVSSLDGVSSRYDDSYGQNDMNLRIEFVFNRNGSFYKKLFFPPLFVASVLILLSFFLDGFKRASLNLLAMLLLLPIFAALWVYAPRSYLPTMMVLYQLVTIAGLISFFLHIIIRWFTELHSQEKPPACVQSFINCSSLRTILGLSYNDSAEYLRIQEEPWVQLAKILNRLTFTILSILFAVAIVLVH